jgi:hypothetical protein
MRRWTCGICAVKRQSPPCPDCGACRGCCDVWASGITVAAMRDDAGWVAFWVNRNGQHHWDGPHASDSIAWGSLSMVTDKSGGYGVAKIGTWSKP